MKYKSKSVVVDGIKFDSQVEAQFYEENKSNILRCHPRYILQGSFIKDGKKRQPITYVADFELKDGTVIDIKGMATEVAKIKRKIFDFELPHLNLQWLCYSKKWGGRVDYDDLLKLRKKNKHDKSIGSDL